MEKNIACELVVEGPADAAGNVVRLNPLRAIPVLERDDGEVFFDSPMICEYIDSLNDQPRLYPASGEARWQALRWHALGQGMMEATVARFVELRKPAEKQDAPTVAKHEARIAAALAFAAERVPASGFISGNTTGIADITLAAALGYIDLRYVHDWRGRHQKLANWFAPISQRPSFVETLAPELKK
ncbi:MAG: glutathione S-transferase C-terminal domain-containing protein, partial [Pseudomonadota bacterium]